MVEYRRIPLGNQQNPQRMPNGMDPRPTCKTSYETSPDALSAPPIRKERIGKMDQGRARMRALEGASRKATNDAAVARSRRKRKEETSHRWKARKPILSETPHQARGPPRSCVSDKTGRPPGIFRCERWASPSSLTGGLERAPFIHDTGKALRPNYSAARVESGSTLLRKIHAPGNESSSETRAPGVDLRRRCGRGPTYTRARASYSERGYRRIQDSRSRAAKIRHATTSDKRRAHWSPESPPPGAGGRHEAKTAPHPTGAIVINSRNGTERARNITQALPRVYD
eukprot:Plantae.Rhodophyta-Hildenbrandia_rubra.ctg2557.p2 GENE.Plantae.Rhodophyta-Hildenbrandia_rubra.ctg2557~~Plantae.Rhodophyta-Hildenbrandia_rubra.ctg2557.p2  ORF type:complete len:285 (+),score=22.70 Plantae.Rhodophyta-Hildenbrandia_rubra.ctg2557:957-1811(+)